MQAFAAQAKLTLAQLAVEGKSNEIPALPKLLLLDLLDVKGRMVTADAMHAQRETAAVVAHGGDYALALKGNGAHCLSRRRGFPDLTCRCVPAVSCPSDLAE